MTRVALGERLHALMEDVSAVGRTANGGVHRLAADAKDGEVRALFRRFLTDAGFEVRVDPIGNIFGLYAFRPGAPWILTGSHLDSQPTAGRLDGAYGVVAAAVAAESAVRKFRELGETPACNLAVVDWTNEEGARFQPSLMGSGTFVGKLDGEEMLDTRDERGVSLREALAAIDCLGTDDPPQPVAAYAEIHIEQGRTLEESGDAVAVVTRNWAALKLQVVFHGEQSHTGPTRMHERRDALLAAAHLIVAVRELAEGREEELHTSVARLVSTPNSPNVVPAETVAFVELRSLDESLLQTLGQQLDGILADIARKTGCSTEYRSRTLRPVFHFDPDGIRLARRAAERAGHAAGDIDTVAGHDAVSLAAVCPSILLFVPSVGGFSHNEREYTDPKHLEIGAEVLEQTLLSLCRGELDSAGTRLRPEGGER